MSQQKEFSVLVVEDDVANRAYLVNRLRSAGISEVFETASTSEAKIFITTLQLDLIFCDWYLGEENGLELLKEVRANRTTRTVPFIMVTGEREKSKVVEALKLGANDYIVKPFSKELLFSKLEKFIPGIKEQLENL